MCHEFISFNFDKLKKTFLTSKNVVKNNCTYRLGLDHWSRMDDSMGLDHSSRMDGSTLVATDEFRVTIMKYRLIVIESCWQVNENTYNIILTMRHVSFLQP